MQHCTNSLHISRSFSLFFALIVPLLVSNCAIQQAKLGHIPLEDLQNWTARGKISISAEGERKTANFRWRNTGEDFTVNLHGPFGSGAATLQRKSNRYFLTDNAQEYQAQSAEELLLDVTGLRIPVSDLHWWIKALPAPQLPTELEVRDSKTHSLSELRQAGWKLKYSNYQTISGHLLPGKIIATRAHLKMVIAIKEWQLRAS